MYSKMLCGLWRKRRRTSEEEEEDDDNSTERHWRQDSPRVHSTQSRILDFQETKREALLCQTERVCGSEKARASAVLARLGLSAQQGPIPSHQLPSGATHNPKCFCNDRTCRIQRHQQSPKTQYEVENLDRNWSEVRTTLLVGSRTPLPPLASQPRRRPSRIPVLSVNLSGQDKEVAGGYRLQTVSHQVEAIREGLKHFRGNSIVSLPPPSVSGRTHAVIPVTAAPPPKPFLSRKRETRYGTCLHPPKVIDRGKTKQKTENARNVNRTNNKTPEVLEPLNDPVHSLSVCLKLLSSKDWEKKVEALQTIRALAQHHPDILMSKLYDVCLAVTAEVQNLRSSVASAAMDTLIYLYSYLQKDMDTQVDRSSQALLVKIAQSSANAFIQEQANVALEALVLFCSPGRVLNALLNTGLSHLSAAVRASTAQKLHLLADRLGADAILTGGKSLSERFLTAVSKMSLDAAAEVRTHGHAILQELAQHRDFMKLWKKTIVEKDRRPLWKILKSVRQK